MLERNQRLQRLEQWPGGNRREQGEAQQGDHKPADGFVSRVLALEPSKAGNRRLGWPPPTGADHRDKKWRRHR